MPAATTGIARLSGLPGNVRLLVGATQMVVMMEAACTGNFEQIRGFGSPDGRALDSRCGG